MEKDGTRKNEEIARNKETMLTFHDEDPLIAVRKLQLNGEAMEGSGGDG